MTLKVFTSNRIESLQYRLAQNLQANPLADPFASEIIVVPTYAMGRWLNLRFAQQSGIAANFHYPQPSQWIWQIAHRLLDEVPAQDPCSADALGWYCFDILPGFLERPAFAPLRQYLADDDDGIRRWQLTQRIAEAFDRYQSYRPDLIQAWSNDEDDHWQAQLWRGILQSRSPHHRIDTIGKLIAQLTEAQPDERLPARSSLFALSSMPPLYLNLIGVLGRHTEIDLYLHSPTDQYWADLENEKRRSRQRLVEPDCEEYFHSGNELLASWGRQGQMFQDLLLADDGIDAVDVELFAEPDAKNLLGKIQQSMFNLDESQCAATVDESVSVHVCHSAMRECQVLLDQILAMLEQDPQLNPEDILVMIPDMSTYAPYIEAVFRHERLPYNLSDITLADEHPVVTTFLQLLRLPRSRFTASEISTLLDNAVLRRRFDIDDAALEEIHRLVLVSNTRWGIDAAHKRRLDLPATLGNTWQQARDRFFAGYALASEELWNGIAPLSGWNDSEAEAIGHFWHFFDRLCRWRERLEQTRNASDWQVLLNHLLDDFFVETDLDESRLQQVRTAISELRQVDSVPLTPALIEYLLARLLRSREQHGQLYSGGITFCGMRPMRSIPFRVICLLGMNHADFPRRDPHSDFELLSRLPRTGDPSRRIEDRYLMLETLMCARSKLYISYTGRSLRDNSAIQPSVLVQELLDFIDNRFVTDSVESARISDALTEIHPMQAFATGNFTEPRFSYSRHWGEVARRLVTPREAVTTAWPDHRLDDGVEATRIELTQLRRFVRHPVRYFFQQRLGIYLGEEAPLKDEEVFELDPLERWQIKQQLGVDTLAQRSDSEAIMAAEGRLGHGQAATAQLDRIRQDQAEWLESLQDYAGLETASHAVELNLDNGVRLAGTPKGYYPGRGLMAFQAGRFKGPHLLELWIDHLALCADGRWQDGDTTQLLTADQHWLIRPVAADTALAQLQDYQRLFCEGMRQPLPILPEASHAWASATDPDQALNRAERSWLGQRAGGDADDPYLQLALRQARLAPIGSDWFVACADRLYAGLIEHGEKQ